MNAQYNVRPTREIHCNLGAVLGSGLYCSQTASMFRPLAASTSRYVNQKG